MPKNDIDQKEVSLALRRNWQNAQEVSVCFCFPLEGCRWVVLKLLRVLQSYLGSLLKIKLLGPFSRLCQNHCSRAWAAALLTNSWDVFIPFPIFLSPFFIIFPSPFSVSPLFRSPFSMVFPSLNIYWISTQGTEFSGLGMEQWTWQNKAPALMETD